MAMKPLTRYDAWSRVMPAQSAYITWWHLVISSASLAGPHASDKLRSLQLICSVHLPSDLLLQVHHSQKWLSPAAH